MTVKTALAELLANRPAVADLMALQIGVVRGRHNYEEIRQFWIHMLRLRTAVFKRNAPSFAHPVGR
jgi:hypothetical protein